MRITNIELAGGIEDNQVLPRAFAKIARKQGDEHITVELLTPGGDRTHHVGADDRDDQWSMAQILQHALDGYEGANSEINDYMRIIEQLAD